MTKNYLTTQNIEINANSSTVVLDHSYRVIETSGTTADLFGINPSQCIGKSLLKMLTFDMKTFKTHMKTLTQKGKTCGRMEIRKATGKTQSVHYVASQLLPSKHFLLSFHKTGNQDEKENQEFKFLSLAGHELRTPLASIKAYIHILKRITEKKSSTNPIQYLEKIDRKADLLTKLINDLLDVERIKQGKLALEFGVIELDHLLKDMIQNLQKTITTHKINLTSTLQTPVVVDRIRLTQAIANLIKNAVEYSPSGSTITISVKQSHQKVILSIRDTGIGIPVSERDKIFEFMYKGKIVKHTEPSLGVGLFITSEIIKLHGGSLSLTSKVGAGSIFTITLPVHSIESTS